MTRMGLRLFSGVSVLLIATAFALAADDKPATQPADKPAAKADKSDAKPEAKAKVGETAPDFTLPDVAGKKHSFAELKDKVVVLEWINKECPWSVKGRPVVADTLAKYKDKGIVWIGIDSTYGRKASDNEAYAREEKIAFPILLDADGKVGRQYGAATTPHLYVIDKGKLVYAGGLHNDQQGTKPKEEFRNYVSEALDAVLAGKAVPVAETKPWGCPVKYQKSEKP